MIINVLEYLEQTASKYPEKTALADDKSAVSFREWEGQARAIGSRISRETGRKVRNPILVFVDRRIEGLIAFMGVVESGNFYVPIDCKMPAERIRLIIEVLNPIAAIYITDKDQSVLESIGFEGIKLNFDEAKQSEIDNTALDTIRRGMIDLDPLYASFTSGSTGVPKGVIITHRGCVDLAEWLVDTFKFSKEDNLGNQTPFYFDGSVKDIYICLKTGATLNVIGKKYFSFPKLLVKFLDERKITTILWATSAIVLIGNSNILAENPPKYLNKVFFAGEAMPAKQLKVWQKQFSEAIYVNLYGPTEITVDCTYYVVDRSFDDDEYIPIGKECRNMQVLVFNEDNELVNPGEIGELCVRGSGVSSGYYGNWQKTNESFVQNPLQHYYRDIIYRTGDMVRYNDEGILEFVSRKDFQVKHNGNRIELGEIEAAVNAIAGITNAACVFDKENDLIILYYTSTDNIDIDIINSVKDRIPKYMFPNKVYHLDGMPYSLNGKIDRIELKRRYENEEGIRCR